MIRTCPTPARLRLLALASGALLSLPAWADADTSTHTDAVDVYALQGEAMAPEVEARLRAQISGQATRAEVRRELAQSQAEGTLVAAGDLADTPAVLHARAAFNERQTQLILAHQEAQRQQQLAAQQAEQVLAAQQAAAAAAQHSPLPAQSEVAATEPAAGAGGAGAGSAAAALTSAAEEVRVLPNEEPQSPPSPADHQARGVDALPLTRPQDAPSEPLEAAPEAAPPQQ